MSTWVGLLRGINVGRNRRIAMAALRETLAGAGCEDPRTLLQSGNAIFGFQGGKETDLKARLEAAVERDFGFAVAVVVRPGAEVTALPEQNPFLAAGVDPGQLHVLFPVANPSARAVAALDGFDAGADEFAVVGRNVFLSLPAGVLKARLTYETLAEHLGPGTVRNWRTTTKLVAAVESA